MMYERLRAEVLDAAKSLKEQGLVALSGGNVSGKDPDSGEIVVTPSGQPYGTMRVDDLVVVDGEGETLEGHWKPTVDLRAHLAAYRGHDNVLSVVHTHSTYATALAVAGRELPPVTSVFADMIGPKPVPVVPYAHVYEEELAEYIAGALDEEMRAVLLGKHGVVTVGPTVHKALKAAVCLEQSARVYAVAEGLGNVNALTEREAREKFEWYQSDYGQEES